MLSITSLALNLEGIHPQLVDWIFTILQTLKTTKVINRSHNQLAELSFSVGRLDCPALLSMIHCIRSEKDLPHFNPLFPPYCLKKYIALDFFKLQKDWILMKFLFEPEPCIGNLGHFWQYLVGLLFVFLTRKQKHRQTTLNSKYSQNNFHFYIISQLKNKNHHLQISIKQAPNRYMSTREREKHTLEFFNTPFVLKMSSTTDHHYGSSFLIESLQKHLVLCNFIWNLGCRNWTIWNKFPSPFQKLEEQGRSLLYI